MGAPSTARPSSDVNVLKYSARPSLSHSGASGQATSSRLCTYSCWATLGVRPWSSANTTRRRSGPAWLKPATSSWSPRQVGAYARASEGSLNTITCTGEASTTSGGSRLASDWCRVSRRNATRMATVRGASVTTSRCAVRTEVHACAATLAAGLACAAGARSRPARSAGATPRFRRAARRSVSQRAAVFAPLRGARVHTGPGIAPDRLVAAVVADALALQPLPPALELVQDGRGKAVFDVQHASVRHHRARGLRRPGVVEADDVARLLQVHAEVDEVHHDL